MSTVKTEFLSEIVSILQKGLGTDEIYEAVFDLLEKTVPFDSATLYLYNQKNDSLEVILQKGNDIVELVREIPFERSDGLSSWVSKQKTPIILESLTKARPGKEGRFCSFVSMPLWVGKSLLGVLNLGHQEPGIFKLKDRDDFEIVSTQISIVLDKIILQKKLQEQNKILQNALNDLEKAQNMLIEKERLAAIGEIVVTVNHEINNPLSSIIGLTEILELTFQTVDPQKVKNGLKAILSQTKRIQRITQQLLEIKSSESQEYIGNTRMIKLP
ncbi:MAG: histidine kinase dimerization/phospho-acceptor domain-containing protein [Candidatus Hatepunaea meridiana]|nr:histidine kinase dimerization/phospho-acceptor domain-containing protein [Candidatus Hatepunaea meridiana]